MNHAHECGFFGCVCWCPVGAARAAKKLFWQRGDGDSISVTHVRTEDPVVFCLCGGGVLPGHTCGGCGTVAPEVGRGD